jgi:hypothetical protein
VADPSPGERDDAPPLLGSWARLYAAVLVWLAMVIAGFTALSWIYR